MFFTPSLTASCNFFVSAINIVLYTYLICYLNSLLPGLFGEDLPSPGDPPPNPGHSLHSCHKGHSYVVVVVVVVVVVAAVVVNLDIVFVVVVLVCFPAILFCYFFMFFKLIL